MTRSMYSDKNILSVFVAKICVRWFSLGFSDLQENLLTRLPGLLSLDFFFESDC